MKTFNFAICDDEEIALTALSATVTKAFAECGAEVTMRTYVPCADIVEILAENHYDVVFLDIDMGDYDGINIGKQLKEKDESTDIIFVSNCEDRVFESFSSHPYGFVRKSNFLKDITDIAKIYVVDREGRQRHTIEIKLSGELYSMDINDLVYVEALGAYQYLHFASKKEPVKIRNTMDSLQKIIQPYGFVRIHKGYSIRYSHIRRIEGYEVITSLGDRLPVSRRMIQELRKGFIESNRKRSIGVFGNKTD